jgi:hypothetical protein
MNVQMDDRPAEGLPLEPQEDDRRKAAVKKLREKREFHSHLVAYVVINAMLIGIWWQGGRGYFWPAWVLLGWGVGLVLNGWAVYFQKPISEDEIQREMRRFR